MKNKIEYSYSTNPNIQQDQKAFSNICEVYNSTIGEVINGGKDQKLLNTLILAEKLIHEECIEELLKACKNFRFLITDFDEEDHAGFDETLDILSEILDGAVDTVYVIMNLLNVLDLPFKEAWTEVHKANMTKAIPSIDPSTGNPIPGTSKIRRREDGKVLKPDGWVKPDIKRIILKHYIDYERRRASK